MTQTNAKVSFKRLIRTDFFWVTLLGLAVFLLYLATMPQTNVGYGDSDLFLLLSQKLGLPLPPGYPLYLWLLALFTRLPLPLSLPAKGHLLSVFFSSLTVAFVFLSSSKIITQLQKQSKQSNHGIRLLTSLIISLTLALNSVFWLYGQIADKYPLSGLLASLFSYFLISLIFSQSERNRKFSFFSLFFVYGLCLSYTYSLWLFTPAIIWTLSHLKFAIKPKTWVIGALLGLIAFLLPLSSLILLNLKPASISWAVENNSLSWFKYFTRSEFFANLYLSEKAPIIFKPLNLNTSVDTLNSYLKFIFTVFSYFTPPLLVLSLIYGYRKYQEIFWPIFINILFLGFGVVIYLGWSEEWLAKSDLLPQLIPGFITLTLGLVFGWHEIVRRFILFLSLLFNRNRAWIIIITFFTASVTLTAAARFKANDLYFFDTVPLRYQKILTELPSRTLLVCFSKVACYFLLYEQNINNLRNDITILPITDQLIKKSYKTLNLNTFPYDENPMAVIDIISGSIGQRPVAAVDMNEYYYNLLGFNYPFLYYLPRGAWAEITKTLPSKLPQYSVGDFTPSTITKISLQDPMRLYLVTQSARDHLLNANLLIKMDQRPRALAELNAAANLFFLLGDKEKEQIETIRHNIEQGQANPAFKPGSRVSSADTLLSYLPNLLARNQINRAYQAAFGALLIEPKNIQARLALAEILQKMGNQIQAEMEYQHVLILDPQNASASAALKKSAIMAL